MFSTYKIRITLEISYHLKEYIFKFAVLMLHLCLLSTEWSKLQIQSSSTSSLKWKNISPPFSPVSTFKTLKKMALINSGVLSIFHPVGGVTGP